MIGRLRGRLAERDPGRVILDVAGVGYEVQIPLSTFYELPDGSEGKAADVELFVHTHVREESLQLFGFATREERSVFERLLSVAGVGPRMALAFLSGIGVSELVIAVHEEDRARLQRIPGVGKKTAERVLLELKDRLTADDVRPPSARPARPSPIRDDALSALTNLGYGREAAGKAIDSVLAEVDDADLETVIRSALRRLLGTA